MLRAFNLLFSTRIMSVLLLVFAISMAVGTFLEQIYTTATAKALVYEASWFETVMVLLILCFIGNIGKYRLWKKEKWPLLIFHLAFVWIFIGGAISRYVGFEGMMSIREGATSEQIISDKTFIKLQVSKDNRIRAYETPYLLAPLHIGFRGRFKFEEDILRLKVIDYVPSAREVFIERSGAEPFLKIVTTAAQGRVENYLERGHSKNFGMLSISFAGHSGPNTLQIYEENGKLYLISPLEGSYTIMATGARGHIQKGVPSELHLRALYQVGSVQWVIPEPVRYGILKYTSAPKSQQENFPDAITAEISSGDLSKTLTFFGKKGQLDMNGQILLGDKQISIGYGSTLMHTPFAIRLNRFELERYPGSSSPSSFASELTLIDGDREQNSRVFMNNVIDYKGYRFFQSGYDPDAKGTHLSVNHDYWGTFISYMGYVLLALGMFLTLFWRGTRFWKLKRTLLEASGKKALFLIFLLPFFTSIQAQHRPSSAKRIELEKLIGSYPQVPKAHLDKFSRWLVQDQGGRIKPIHTMALELLRKIYKQDHIGAWSALQWMLAIHQDPTLWTQAPFIKVGNKSGDKLLKVTKADKHNYTSLMDLYHFEPATGQVDFILQRDYEQAFSKSPAQRDEYDKALIDLNERVGIISGILQGQYLRVFPIPKDPEHTWTGWMRADMKIDTTALEMLNEYFVALAQAQKSGRWQEADQRLEKIGHYQQRYGHEIMPSPSKVEAEIFYNNTNIFYRAMLAYALLGTLLLLLAFARLFFFSSLMRVSSRVLILLMGLTFLTHAFGLGLRWYISGHAPWSNGYESAVFISWCMIMAGWIFYRKTNLFIPSIAALSATALLGVAHGNLMSPEVTHLVPVLKSYWLMVHVAIITSSYGFFAVGGFLGLTVLILYILQAFAKRSISENAIKELTLINEMTLMVGLFLLTIGTFLGGVWANESWGRYWSWDPKETWAFISVMVYAFVLHMRLVPGLRGIFAFNFASILSLASIVMTYFGVNYYLSGLHSYAKGDPVPIPRWIYYAVFSVFLIAVMARYQIRKLSGRGK